MSSRASGSPLGDEAPQLLALEQLHDDEQPPVVLAHVVDGDDVGVAEPGARLRLAEEAGAKLVGDLDVARDDLEGHEAIEDRVMGLEDHAHAAAPDPLEDLVLPDLLRHATPIWSVLAPQTTRPRIGCC